MRLSPKQYASALHELLLEGDTEEVLANFSGFLRKRGDQGKWGQILNATIDKIEDEQKRERLIIVTQFALEDSEKQLLQKKVEELYPGKICECQYEVEEGIIGGFQIRGRDTLYDATLLHSLKQLSHTLKS